MRQTHSLLEIEHPILVVMAKTKPPPQVLDFTENTLSLTNRFVP